MKANGRPRFEFRMYFSARCNGVGSLISDNVPYLLWTDADEEHFWYVTTSHPWFSLFVEPVLNRLNQATGMLNLTEALKDGRCRPNSLSADEITHNLQF